MSLMILPMVPNSGVKAIRHPRETGIIGTFWFLAYASRYTNTERDGVQTLLQI